MSKESTHAACAAMIQRSRPARPHLSKDALRWRLEGVERENLNPPVGLRASHEWMGDVSTIPEAGRQNPGSDKTRSSSASRDSTQAGELERVMSLETALARALRCLGAIWPYEKARTALGKPPAATFTKSVPARAGMALI